MLNCLILVSLFLLYNEHEGIEEVIKIDRKISLIRYLILLTLISMIAMNAVSTVNAGVDEWGTYWVGVTYSGHDDYFRRSVNAYEPGAEATLVVEVHNDYYLGYPYYTYPPVNISAVKVCPDWNINYTSTEVSEDSPIVIEHDQHHIFRITFTVPNTTVASNLVLHEYRIYVEHVNSTTGAKKVVDAWTFSRCDFAVYLAEQDDCMEIKQKYEELIQRCMGDWWYDGQLVLTCPEAQCLMTNADLELEEAKRIYQTGDFTEAMIHFQSMGNLTEQALETEATKGSELMDSGIDLDKALANAAAVEANAVMMQSFGYILLGLGLTFFGIGMIIYGIKRK